MPALPALSCSPYLLLAEIKGCICEKQNDTTWGWFGWKPPLSKTDSFWLVELHVKACCTPRTKGGQRKEVSGFCRMGAGGWVEKKHICCSVDFGTAEFLCRVTAVPRSCLHKGNPIQLPSQLHQFTCHSGLPAWCHCIVPQFVRAAGGKCSKVGALVLAAAFFLT